MATAEITVIAMGRADPSASSYVAATGYVRTTAVGDLSAPGTVEGCAVARASSISLFPTSFAPRGVVLIELRRASARCLVQGSAHTASATYDYEAVVQYWDGVQYRTGGIVTPATMTDPLDAVDLATTSVGGSRVLGDYIASWSLLTGPEVISAETAGVASVKLPGVVTIASQPVRIGVTPSDVDLTSVMSVAVGALSCSAHDAR